MKSNLDFSFTLSQFIDKYANKSGQAVKIQDLIHTDRDNAVDRARLL